MPRFKSLTFFFTFFALFNACITPVAYQLSKNSESKIYAEIPKNNSIDTLNRVSKGKRLPINPYVLFNFSTTITENPLLKSSMVEVFREIKLNVDSITLTPLTYTTIDEVKSKIIAHNTDGVFIITPLNNVIGTSKHVYTIASMNYLLEFRMTYESADLKKCVLTFNTNGLSEESKIKEDTKQAIRQFLSF